MGTSGEQRASTHREACTHSYLYLLGTAVPLLLKETPRRLGGETTLPTAWQGQGGPAAHHTPVCVDSRTGTRQLLKG